MASTRLPGKPLADIAGMPMIVHVMRRARGRRHRRAMVATDSEAVQAAVEKAGGRAVMTRADHASGSDRIFEALAGARPDATSRSWSMCRATCRPSTRRHPRRARPLADPAVDIATLAAVITDRTSAPTRTWSRRSGRPWRPARLARTTFTRATTPTARGRTITISASTPIAARRWSGSSRCRHRPRAAREARAVARARRRHAHRCCDREKRPARRRYARGSGESARECWPVD